MPINTLLFRISFFISSFLKRILTVIGIGVIGLFGEDPSTTTSLYGDDPPTPLEIHAFPMKHLMLELLL